MESNNLNTRYISILKLFCDLKKKAEKGELTVAEFEAFVSQCKEISIQMKEMMKILDKDIEVLYDMLVKNMDEEMVKQCYAIY